MTKTILYRLLGLGAVPGKLRPILQQEGVLIVDEGVPGRFIARDVKGPAKRYVHRSEAFSGCLVLTHKRLIGFSYWKRQINIATDDPKITDLYVDVRRDGSLSLSFESSVFRDGWQGVIEFRFGTDKATQFRDSLVSLGVRPGTASPG